MFIKWLLVKICNPPSFATEKPNWFKPDCQIKNINKYKFFLVYSTNIYFWLFIPRTRECVPILPFSFRYVEAGRKLNLIFPGKPHYSLPLGAKPHDLNWTLVSPIAPWNAYPRGRGGSSPAGWRVKGKSNSFSNVRKCYFKTLSRGLKSTCHALWEDGYEKCWREGFARKVNCTPTDFGRPILYRSYKFQ